MSSPRIPHVLSSSVRWSDRQASASRTGPTGKGLPQASPWKEFVPYWADKGRPRFNTGRPHAEALPVPPKTAPKKKFGSVGKFTQQTDLRELAMIRAYLNVGKIDDAQRVARAREQRGREVPDDLREALEGGEWPGWRHEWQPFVGKKDKQNVGEAEKLKMDNSDLKQSRVQLQQEERLEKARKMSLEGTKEDIARIHVGHHSQFRMWEILVEIPWKKRTIAINVDPDFTVEMLKYQVARIEGIHAEVQRLYIRRSQRGEEERSRTSSQRSQPVSLLQAAPENAGLKRWSAATWEAQTSRRGASMWDSLTPRKGFGTASFRKGSSMKDIFSQSFRKRSSILDEIFTPRRGGGLAQSVKSGKGGVGIAPVCGGGWQVEGTSAAGTLIEMADDNANLVDVYGVGAGEVLHVEIDEERSKVVRRRVLTHLFGGKTEGWKFETTVMQAFQKTDLDGGGSLDADEIRMAFENMDVFLSTAQIEYILDEFDSDGNGEFDQSEFRDMVIFFINSDDL